MLSGGMKINMDHKGRTKKITIIIPCYNRYEIFDNCLPMLEKQSSKNFNVIIIDDCSTNKLFLDLQQYADKSSLDISVLKNKKNIGPGATRNRGIDEATGDYTMFIDSDDYIIEDAIEILTKYIGNYSPDCIYYDFVKKKGNKVKEYKAFREEIDIIDKSKAMIYGNYSTWCKVFKTDILQQNKQYGKISFGDIPLGEDYIFTKLALAACKTIAYCRKQLYVYVDTKNSLMKNYSFGTYAEEQYRVLKEALYEDFPEELQTIYIYLMIYSRLSYMIYKRETRKKLLGTLSDIFTTYEGWYKNPYIQTMPLQQRFFLYGVRKQKILYMRIYIRLFNLLKSLLD